MHQTNLNIPASRRNARTPGGVLTWITHPMLGIGMRWAGITMIGSLWFSMLLHPTLTDAASDDEEKKPKDAVFELGEPASYRKCLMITATNYKDSPGRINSHDWVTMTLENRCGHPVGRVHAALVLMDGSGNPFGTQLWLLEPGMTLRPGSSWQERFAIPDPKGLIATHWAIRVISSQGFPPPPKKPAP